MGDKDEKVKKRRVIDARARNISHNVRCTECGSQSIEDSQADVAILLRKLIRDEIQAGKTDKEIYKKLEDDFGETMLYTPKFDMQTAALWLSPVLVAGGAAAIWAYKNHKQKTNVHIMALNLVRGVPLTPKEKETLLDLLTPPPSPRRRDLKRALDIEASKGLRVVQAQMDLGSIVCSFIVPDRLSDKDGNWQAGAIATLIDSIGVGVNYYLTGILHATVDLSISYLSNARIQEEVKIEVKVLGPRGKLSLVMVEIRKKEDGKLIALANLWLGSVKANVIQLSKI